MAITISGTTGIAGVDGSAGTPAVQGTDTNTGVFYPAADTVGVSTGGSERVRVDSSGNVGIGLTSYNLPLSVKADANGQNVQLNGRTGDDFGQIFFRNFGGANNLARIASDNNAGLIFGTGSQTAPTVPTERMRIDSSGNLLVGTTSSNGRLSVDSAGATSATYAVYVRNSTPSDLFYLRSDGFFSTGGAASSPYNATTATAANVVVASNGQLQRSTSSLKYKTDVHDATHGLVDLLKLRSVTYKGKNDGDTVFGGLIAEEVEAAGLTEFVQYADDGTPDALAYGNMVSLCIKAIQEQQALITALTARIESLETK